MAHWTSIPPHEDSNGPGQKYCSQEYLLILVTNVIQSFDIRAMPSTHLQHQPIWTSKKMPKVHQNMYSQFYHIFYQIHFIELSVWASQLNQELCSG